MNWQRRCLNAKLFIYHYVNDGAAIEQNYRDCAGLKRAFVRIESKPARRKENPLFILSLYRSAKLIDLWTTDISIRIALALKRDVEKCESDLQSTMSVYSAVLREPSDDHLFKSIGSEQISAKPFKARRVNFCDLDQ